MNLEAIPFSILLPAFLAGLLVLATHVPLGSQVLARGIVFIDLAIAQIASLGVIVADRFGFAPEGGIAQIAALSTALMGAAFLTYTERLWPEVQEALIGVLFVLAVCGGILLVANNPHGGEHLQELLSGQILWVRLGQLWSVAAISAVILLLWFWHKEQLGRFGFYAIFSVAVTTSVQLVGVYLVFASLIVPALAARNFSKEKHLRIAYIIGVAGYTLGLVLSLLFDLPSGPMIVWTLVACGLCAQALRSLTAVSSHVA